MVKISDLRVCMECGNVYAKKPTGNKLVLQCPNCSAVRRTTIDP